MELWTAAVVSVLWLIRLGLRAAGMSVGRCLMKVPNESGGVMAETLLRNASIFRAMAADRATV